MTDKSYIYRGAPGSRAFGALLQPGDYSFVVSSADAPYFKNNKWILGIKLTIQPHDIPVFANPWSGIDKNGEDRDGIAEFLLAVNRAPASGDEPEWGRLIGAKGKCRLKIEPDQNNVDRNKVAFFHRPKQTGPSTEGPSQSFTESEIKKSQTAIAKTLGVKDPDLGIEPDDIPF
ncbi:MAG TPA: hypothetical protein VN957_27410 [Chthoniobacterales bacterium]|nr:hypothetical protein [Chthoniobacterales bacterium]